MKRHSERHRSARIGWLRAAVLGADDGILSTASLVVGVAAAGSPRHQILLAGVAGLVCLGYPFHPVGKPTQLRVAHLQTLKTPPLIMQGERDTFGNREEVATYQLSPAIEVKWLTDGDHSFKPRKSSGVTEKQNWESAIDAIAAFASK